MTARSTERATLLAATGTVWTIAAAALALSGLAQVATGHGITASQSAVGRLEAAYLTAMLLGAVGIPSGAVLLRSTGSTGRSAIWLWSAGVALAVVAFVMIGVTVPALAAQATIGLGVAVWLAAMWRGIGRPGGTQGGTETSTWQALGLAGGAAVITFAPLAAAATGAVQLFAFRGLVLLGLAPICLAVVCLELQTARGEDLLAGTWTRRFAALWLPLGLLASGHTSSPDLLPTALARLCDTAAALLVIPAAAMVVRAVGIARSAAPRSAPLAPETVLAVTGLVLAGAAIAADGLLAGDARAAVRFSSWDPASALFPPFAGLFLIATAAASRLSGAQHTRWGRWMASGSVATALLGAAAMWPLGLFESTSGWKASADAAQALARMPWAAALLFTGVAGICAVAAGGEREQTWRDRAVDAAPTGPPRAHVLAFAAAALSTGLFALVFLPEAMAPAGPAPDPKPSALGVDPVLAERGREIYERDGCAACHTQRLLPSDATRGWGAPTTLEAARSRTSPGMRRAGPDLTWVGDRYGSVAALGERLRVHGPDGAAAPHGWLFRPEPTVEGTALAAYLAGLRSGGTAEGVP